MAGRIVCTADLSSETVALYNVHRGEYYQERVGGALQANPPPCARVFDYGTQPGTNGRYECCNPCAIYPGDPTSLCPDRLQAAFMHQFITEERPHAVVELHNTLAITKGDDYDSLVIVHPNPTPAIWRFAGYAASLGLPIVTAPPTFIAGNHRQAMLFEMDPRDRRFRYERVWQMIGQIATNTIPDAPPPPCVYAFQKDISCTAAEEASIDVSAYVSPFSSLDPALAQALGLHADTQLVNARASRMRDHWATAVTTCPDTSELYATLVE